ncbi:MAG: class I tRNA ligase family protein, partial [Candidatus Hadarchaeales archaeon]
VATRYENGVESVGDWIISRQRYWGIPLPIWACEKCGEITVVGGMEELKALAPGTPSDLDLHRPAVDEITFPCNCGGKKRRVPDVLDVWFDSGVASWASLDYPKKEMERWPADFITEGEDQVTKWFYSQQVLSVVAVSLKNYRTALMHGFVLEMSPTELLSCMDSPWMRRDERCRNPLEMLSSLRRLLKSLVLMS